jgi:hypothetical protein
MQFRKGLIVPVIAIGLAIGFAGPAAAGTPPVIKIAKHPDGPYVSPGVRLNIGDGVKKSAHLKVRATTDSNVEVSLEQPEPAPLDWVVKYFKANGTNITDAVMSDEGFGFVAKPDRSKRFSMTVKRRAGSEIDDCVHVVVHSAFGSPIAFAAVNTTTGTCE